ncbi:MAG: aldo/keto reductase [Alphaproteobacteria bacterium]
MEFDNKLGLGCAAFGGLFEAVPAAAAHETLSLALKNGLTYFDTAPYYGLGRSEQVVGAALQDQPITLSTKVGRVLEPGAMDDPAAIGWPDALPNHPIYDYSYDGIMRSFHDSVARLGRTPNILYIHDIGTMTHGDDGALHFAQAMDGGYRALDELRRAGDIQAIGIGVNEVAVLDQALDYGQWDLFLLAGRYTLLEQEPLDSFFPKCDRAGTNIVVGGPFNSGILVGGDTFNYEAAPQDVVARAKALGAICADHQVPLAAAALAFPAAHPLVASVIPGPRSAPELQQILDWAKTDIPASLWDDLKSAKLLAINAPTPTASLL